MRACFTKLIQDEAGVTAIEYGLIAALIAIAAIAAFSAVGSSLSSTFSYIAGKLQSLQRSRGGRLRGLRCRASLALHAIGQDGLWVG